MRARRTSTVALFFLLALAAIQVVVGEDLYWEGENEGSNEFLEVNEDNGLVGHLKRFKRQFNFFNFLTPSTSTTTTESSLDAVTEDQPSIDEEGSEDNDFEGSGLPDRERDPEPEREKTLRVTFVVIQPYRTEYSNRDSKQFQAFAKSLADEVNLLYDSLPGTQRASLVRIQSRVSDNFSCKVTLDIVTTGYDNTDKISDMLRDHIRERRTLGAVAVSDADFSANVADPRYNIEACADDELRCNDGHCVSVSARCNGRAECDDGSDEDDCPVLERTTFEPPREVEKETEASWFPWRSAERGAVETTTVQDIETTTLAEEEKPDEFTCPYNEIRCDETRCITANQRCDGVPDCYDGTDEAGCDEHHRLRPAIVDDSYRETQRETLNDTQRANPLHGTVLVCN